MVQKIGNHIFTPDECFKMNQGKTISYLSNSIKCPYTIYHYQVHQINNRIQLLHKPVKVFNVKDSSNRRVEFNEILISEGINSEQTKLF
ncbi:hypothetical protein BGL34_01990 [Fructilactobacillus lindneri]|uniref:Uncharacterized protein n=1 Tax=Fructilactobacillus lindneri TaxID=53444 RepID=A0AB33BFB7_9LACO|nr:hypothetical protein AYR60_04595 [Fructilactobacillus lindneri]POH24877.1 hypothetical protein BHU33_02515 [Fructilactobacillus lindneri DSM 20690 = JCM 11027]ANZ59382.1 hypothetical protein AYR59_04850 [Fructilactobacillus lindneri]POG98834.1 hypothetical protein BGL31_02580 [Fructilactobacillus lindneri]POH03107.1 hypothetical protein BGL33_04015 [Fructilactobacillus lindneri]